MTGPSLSEAIRARRISGRAECHDLPGFGGLSIRDGGEGMSVWHMVKLVRRSLDMTADLLAAPRSALSREHRDAALRDCFGMMHAAFKASDSIEV